MPYVIKLLDIPDMPMEQVPTLDLGVLLEHKLYPPSKDFIARVWIGGLSAKPKIVSFRLDVDPSTGRLKATADGETTVKGTFNVPPTFWRWTCGFNC